jgi:hypothetical protein
MVFILKVGTLYEGQIALKGVERRDSTVFNTFCFQIRSLLFTFTRDQGLELYTPLFMLH